MIKVIDLDFKKPFDIDLPETGTGEKQSLCPRCSHNRKSHNQKKKCLSWNYDKQTGYCHNCNASFVIPINYEKKEYKRPEWINNTNLSDKVIKYFESRGISQSAIKQAKITEGKEWMPQVQKEVNTIQFNYFRDGKLINIKYRDGQKNFKLYKDAELIFYGLDDIKDQKIIGIVEGEFDKLAFQSVGIHNVVSVPNGANVGNNNLQYLDNCFDYFKEAEKIILATDNDLPGVKLRNELASRIGIEKCYKVNFEDCKDANEYLQKNGFDKLRMVFDNAEPFPIDGIYSANDFEDDLDLLYRQGLKPGKKIDIEELDEIITYEKGRLYTITGIPGHGKSEVLDFILTKLNVIHGWKVGYFSPENHPLQLHASKIIEKISGFRFNSKYLSYKDYEKCKIYIKDNFFFVNPTDDYKLETILTSIRLLKFKHGIDCFVLDPYNKIEHQFNNNESETNYISRVLDKLINFAKRNDIALFLVAHPRKMSKHTNGLHEIPTLYDINGSANFYNKTDFGITVYRDMKTNRTEIFIQKVKFKHLGKIGSVETQWNMNNGRYAIFKPDDIKNTGDIVFDNSNWLDSKIETFSDKYINEEDDFFNPNNDFTNELPF